MILKTKRHRELAIKIAVARPEEICRPAWLKAVVDILYFSKGWR